MKHSKSKIVLASDSVILRFDRFHDRDIETCVIHCSFNTLQMLVHDFGSHHNSLSNSKIIKLKKLKIKMLIIVM